jgi:hypothetical protein
MHCDWGIFYFHSPKDSVCVGFNKANENHEIDSKQRVRDTDVIFREE